MFPSVHGKKCSTYTPSHRGATAAPSASCNIRLFLPGRNEYYDSVISASHSNNDLKHAREVRSLPGQMVDEQSPFLQADTPTVAISYLMSCGLCELAYQKTCSHRHAWVNQGPNQSTWATTLRRIEKMEGRKEGGRADELVRQWPSARLRTGPPEGP